MAGKPKVAVVMELEWPYKRHYEVFAGIRDYADEQGGWDFDVGDFPQYGIQQGLKYAGIIGRISADCYKAACAAGIPVVNVKVDSPVASKAPGVYPDIRAAGRMAAEHLILRGLKRLVHFGFHGSRSSRLHCEGMREVAKAHGCDCKSYRVDADFHEHLKQWKGFMGYTKKSLDSWQPPIGVAFSSDELAHAVTAICINQGWSIPDQMAVIGTNNEVMICNSSRPTLSSIDMAYETCGYEAARLLDQLIKGVKGKIDLIRHVQPRELVLRRSSDAYAVDDAPTVRAMAFMAENSHQRLSVADIAKAAGIGRQSLELRFRKLLKRSINDELIRLRITRMKRLLVETALTVEKISDQVGFGTTANMHVMFKRATGMTPKAYRRKHNPRQRTHTLE